jgi:hypothetical protein
LNLVILTAWSVVEVINLTASWVEDQSIATLLQPPAAINQR